MLQRDFIDKLRSLVPISEIIGKKVKLKQKGKDFIGLCPFHNEKTPSFTVNDQKGFYHCFGCQAHGDIISFVMNSEGLQYKEAVLKISNQYGIEVPSFKTNVAEEEIKNRDLLLLEKATAYFEKNLQNNYASKAKLYLKKRELNEEIIKKFRLGFASNSYSALLTHLKELGFNDQELLRSGIIAKNDNGNLYEKLRNRIIFPIINRSNNVIAFGGRTIEDDIPKYLNSAETEIFKKNQTLYNINNARKSIFDQGFVILVEGYMDVIALSKNNIDNVVAGLGTSISKEHIKQLFYITNKIIICLDGDFAGRKAAKRVADLALPLISHNKAIEFLFLPNQLDPDEFIAINGLEEMKKAIKNSKPLSTTIFDFYLEEISNGINVSAEQKAKLEFILNSKVNEINDTVCKKHFLNFFQNSLFYLGKKGSKFISNKILSGSNIKILNNKQEDIIAINIIALLIQFPELLDYQDDLFNFREIELASKKYADFKELVVDLIDNNSQNILLMIEKSNFNQETEKLKNIISKIHSSSTELIRSKFKILLLKDLLFQVELQYKESLENIDEINTHQTAIISQKIKELFDYKNSLQSMVRKVEKEIV
jgi:DNA primase